MGAFTLRSVLFTHLKWSTKLNVERWTLHTVNERNTGDITEATSQTSQLSVAANNNHLATCFALRTIVYVCFCPITVVTNVCWVSNELTTLTF